MKTKLIALSLFALFSVKLKAAYFESDLIKTADAYEKIFDLYDQEKLTKSDVVSLKKGYSALMEMQVNTCEIIRRKNIFVIFKSSCKKQLEKDFKEFSETYESLGISKRSFDALAINVKETLKNCK